MRGVLADGEVEHQAFGEPVGRHVRRALGAARGARAPCRRRRPPRSPRRGRRGRAGAPAGRCRRRRRRRRSRPPRALNEMSSKPVPAQPSTRSSGASSASGCVLRREGRLERAADDHREQLVVRDLGDGGRPADRAVAQHGDPVGDLPHLGEPVRDVDDGRSLAPRACGRAEEQLDGVLRERRRRLVEDQEPRRDGEGLRELEEVPAGDAERRDAVLEVAEEVHVVEQRRASPVACPGRGAADARRRPRPGCSRPPSCRAAAPGCWWTIAMPSSCAQRRREVLDALAVEDDRAAVGRRGAGRDVHQRRLAGAVLAEQGVNLAGQHVERDVVSAAIAA